MPDSVMDPSERDATARARRPSRILAIETSGRVGSVALGLGTPGAARPTTVCVEHFAHGMRHAVALMPTIQRLVAQQGWRPADLDDLYVSTGPGSFTGLRIAIAVARALHQALGCRIVAVPTVDVLASNAPADVQNLVIALDAKRGQIFAARYQRAAAGGLPVAHPPDVPPVESYGADPGAAAPLWRVAGPALVDPAEFVRQTPRPVSVLGEGVEYHRPALRAGVDSDSELREIDKTLWPGSAEAVLRLGWLLRDRPADPTRLLPVYLRLPEAQELWEKRHGGGIASP